jgi:hypothetical protein
MQIPPCTWLPSVTDADLIAVLLLFPEPNLHGINKDYIYWLPSVLECYRSQEEKLPDECSRSQKKHTKGKNR